MQLPSHQDITPYLQSLTKEQLIDTISQFWLMADPHHISRYMGDLIADYYLSQMSFADFAQEVESFCKESYDGKYYFDYDWSKLGINYESEQFQDWFNKIGILLDTLCMYAKSQPSLDVKLLFDDLFELIEDMESNADIVFAHEYGEGNIFTREDYREVYENLVIELA